MFVDAAALVAILSNEDDAERCATAIANSESRFTSPIAVWEATMALASARKWNVAASRAESVVMRFIDDRGIDFVDLPPASVAAALSISAAERFGSGRRRLNLADCFHYACAKHHGLPILSTADEFRLTDLEVVP